MRRTLIPSVRITALAGLGLLALGGCIPPDEPEFAPVTAKRVQPIVPSASAGLPVTVSTDETAMRALIARSQRFGRRSDPFLLLPNEIQFERSQTVERLLAEQGSFDLQYQAPVPPEPRGAGAQPDPQPYRRLSGVVIGDAVVGILETLGQETVIIRPGQLLPGTEWRVVLINEDRAVLRRAGNRLPREITVRLELPPPGVGGGGQAPAGGGPGRGGGVPGGGEGSDQ